MFEQGARLGPPIKPLRESPAVGRETTIHLAGTDAHQLLLHRGAEPEAAARPRQPQRQERVQPPRPGISGGFPDGPERVDRGRTVRDRPAPRGRGSPRRRMVQEPDGVLAMVASHLTELVEDLPLLRAPGLPVALIDRLNVLPFRVRTHASCLHRPGTVTSPMARRFPLGNILDGAIRSVAILSSRR
jgi:hypothetical protein